MNFKSIFYLPLLENYSAPPELGMGAVIMTVFFYLFNNNKKQTFHVINTNFVWAIDAMIPLIKAHLCLLLLF